MPKQPDGNDLMPGDRVEVYDYKEKKYMPATVIRRYGFESNVPLRLGCATPWQYPDVIDVLFDHRPEEVSRAHFNDFIRRTDAKAPAEVRHRAAQLIGKREQVGSCLLPRPNTRAR